MVNKLDISITDKDKNKIKYYYGLNENYVDITNIVNNLLKQKEFFTITNKIIGIDPVPNKVKKLKVVYNSNEYFFEERATFRLNYVFPKNVYDISKINDIMNEYDKVTIFGKGPTFKKVEKKKGELRCAINQASNIIDNVDLICMNDEHNIDLVKDNVYKNLKYLLIPEYQHVKQKFSKDGHWLNVYKKLKGKFNGIYIIYNLRTNPIPNEKFITLPSTFTSANNCVDFICIFTKIKIINLYGIGVNSKQNYNKLFIGNGHYTIDRTERIKTLINNICYKYKVKCMFN